MMAHRITALVATVPAVVFATILALSGHPAAAVETIEFKVDEKTQTATGELLIEAQNGGVMMRADDGKIWVLQPDQIIKRQSTDAEFQAATPEQIAARMLDELGPEFSVYKTQHYLIVYNSSDGYAKQVGGLFEQLYRGFFAFWKNQRWDLPEPEFPLVAVVLKDYDSYLQHAGAEIGERAESVIGYYNLASNQMTTFNVPNWERNVATIIHEATHQLAYNCGLQKRFADNPKWVSEGLAMFFETPDMRNPGRWRSIGRVNPVNLMRWRQYERQRPAESLFTLLSNDARYENASSATSAYGESWALTYFLIKTKRKEYVAYLQKLSEGQPLAELSPRQRIDMFEQAFDMTLVDLDKQFVMYLRRVRAN